MFSQTFAPIPMNSTLNETAWDRSESET